MRVLHFTGETPNPNSPSKNRPEQAKSAHENPWSATLVRELTKHRPVTAKLWMNSRLGISSVSVGQQPRLRTFHG